jgi:hypothetical protein
MIWLLAAAALAAQAAQDDPQTNLQELHQVWQDSCAQRAYGYYDDMCEQLGIQIHAAEVAADRAAHAARRKKPKPDADKPAPAAVSTPTAVAPPAAAPAPASPPSTPQQPLPLGYTPPPHPMS